jgi:hypothetical protein
MSFSLFVMEFDRSSFQNDFIITIFHNEHGTVCRGVVLLEYWNIVSNCALPRHRISCPPPPTRRPAMCTAFHGHRRLFSRQR